MSGTKGMKQIKKRPIGWVNSGSYKKGHNQMNTGKTHFKKGRKISEEQKETLRKRNKKMGIKPPHYIGNKHPNWKGGITPKNVKIRNSIEYKLWRKAVFERDWFTCIWCGYKGKSIEADHIKSFADFPELRFAIDNGRTLCFSCHKKVTLGGNDWENEVEEYLEEHELLCPDCGNTPDTGACFYCKQD